MIKFENVNFTYNKSKSGLHEINLEIKDGELILLCGTSGCGKTTLIRLINGLIPNFYEGELTGSVNVDGINIPETPLYKLSGKIGSVFQNPRSQFFNVDTTSELAFGCENLGMPEEDILKRIHKAENELKLGSLMNRNIFMLSGGEKQRIACGSVATLNPDIIVLDEPSSNLDMSAINDLKNIIKLWKQQGKTIIISEHRLFYLAYLCDRVIFMKDGKIYNIISGEKFRNLELSVLAGYGLRTNSLDKIKYNIKKIPPKSEMFSIDNFVYKYKNGETALNIPHTELPVGGVTALIGHNGAGKSTFSQLLCGLINQRKSIITLHGEKLNFKKRISRCYMVMQDVNHQLFTESVADEVMLSQKTENKEQALEIIKQLDLEKFSDVHPMSLSGGQKQRTAICSAIASESEIVIYDEPTSGLDLMHMAEVAENINKLKEQGKTQIIVTHDLEFILSCCDYIVLINNGKMEDKYPLDENGIEKVIDYFKQQITD